MSYAYPRNIGTSTLPSFVPSKSLRTADRPWGGLPRAAKQWIAEVADSLRTTRLRNRDEVQRSSILVLKRVFTIANAIILLWILTLWWGERTVFRESIEACAWENWESWVSCSWHYCPLEMQSCYGNVTDRWCYASLKMQHHIMSPSSPTRNSLIPTPTPAGHGHSQP